MSFILEALKKAEQERNLGRAPDLQMVHPSAESSPRRLWPWLLSGTLLINAVLLGWFMIGFYGNDQPQSDALSLTRSSADSESINNETINTAEDSNSPLTSSSLNTNTAEAVAPAELDSARMNAPRLTTPRLSTPRLTTNESLLPRTPVATDVGDSQWSSLEIPDTVTGSTVEALPGSANPGTRVEIATAPLITEASLLPLEAMSADFRNALPSLNLDIHVYSERPERRFVLINSKRYQQGEWLDEGPLLESITTDGVVLSFLQKRFTLNVQR